MIFENYYLFSAYRKVQKNKKTLLTTNDPINKGKQASFIPLNLNFESFRGFRQRIISKLELKSLNLEFFCHFSFIF